MDTKRDSQWPVLSSWPKEKKEIRFEGQYLIIRRVSKREHEVRTALRKARRFIREIPSRFEKQIYAGIAAVSLIATVCIFGSWLFSEPDISMYPPEVQAAAAEEYEYKGPADQEALESERTAYIESHLESWEVTEAAQ